MPASTFFKKSPKRINSEIFTARDHKSKEKCIKFFGDHSLPIQIGTGKTGKLEKMLLNIESGKQEDTKIVPALLALPMTPVATPPLKKRQVLIKMSRQQQNKILQVKNEMKQLIV